MSDEFDAVRQSIYPGIIEASPDAIFLADAKSGLIVEANKQASGLIGRPRKEIIGMHQSDLHPKEEADHYREIFRQHLQKGTAIEEDIFVLHRDGHCVPVEITASTIEIDGRQFIHGIFRDVTGRKQTEDSLRREIRFSQSVIERAAEGICVCHNIPDFPFVCFTVWNDRMTEITGYSMEEINQKGWYQTLYPDADYRQKAIARMGSMRQGEDLLSEEWDITRVDGQKRTVLIASSVLQTFDEGTYVLAVMNDITARKLAEQEIAKSRRLLVETEGVGKVGGWEFDVDTGKQTWTEETYRIHELDLAYDPTVENGVNFYTPESRPIIERAVQQIVEHGEPFDLELEIRTAKGNLRNVHIIGQADPERRRVHGFFQDVTERKQAESKLIEGEQRYKALFQSVADYALVLEMQESGPPIIVDANDAAFEKHGYTRAEMIGQPISFLDSDSSRQQIEDRLRQIKSGKSVRFEVEHVRKNGTVFEAEVAARMFEYEGKQLFFAVERDITERKQAHDELLAKEMKLSRAQIVARMGFIDWNLKTNAVELSSQMYGLLGIQPVEGGYSVDDIFNIVHPDDMEFAKKNLALAVQEKKEYYIEHRMIRTDGTTMWVLARAEVSRGADGNPEKLLGTMTDITERKQAEEALQQRMAEGEENRKAMLFMLEDLNASTASIEQAKKEWEETFDAVTDPIFLHDHEFRIVRANRAYAEQAGMSVEKVIGKLYWEVFPKGDGPLPGCVKALEKAEEEEEEIKTGNGRIFRSHSYAIKGEAGRHGRSIHFMQEITEQKQAAINLEHVNRALTTLSMVNHELVHAQSEPDLLHAICRAVVEQHGYRMAWVGYVQHDKKRSIEIMASAGAEDGLLDAIQPSWAECASGMGPSGRAARSGEMQVTQDIAADTDYQQWGDALLKSGCRAEIALPMVDADNRIFSLLHVYAEQVNAFTDREIALLQEMAEDLAFGVRTLRLSAHRDEMLEVNQKQLLQIHSNLQETIAAVARAVGARDPYTAGHQLRVTELATAIARAMELDEHQIEGIRMGATIHDIGKIQTPAEILSKPSRLTDVEYNLIKSHSQAGYDILKDIHFPWPVADIAHQHHERLDGSGYPQGLKGEEICLEARIVAVADIVESMASHRPYRPGLGIEVALKEIESQRGTYLDADAVDACLKLFRDNEFSFEE